MVQPLIVAMEEKFVTVPHFNEKHLEVRQQLKEVRAYAHDEVHNVRGDCRRSAWRASCATRSCTSSTSARINQGRVIEGMNAEDGSPGRSLSRQGRGTDSQREPEAMSDAHDKRKFNVRLAILRALNSASGYFLPENVLHRDVNLDSAAAAHCSPNFAASSPSSSSSAWSTMVAGSLGGARKIRLTDAGRAEVAANL
jgi:hypothetical protein